MSEELVERLDKIAAILSLAFADEIESAKRRIRANQVADALLDAAEEWTQSGELQQRVAALTSKTTRTVRTEIAHLLSIGALTSQGPSNSPQYKSTGLI
jgi:hypothetical protein